MRVEAVPVSSMSAATSPAQTHAEIGRVGEDGAALLGELRPGPEQVLRTRLLYGEPFRQRGELVCREILAAGNQRAGCLKRLQLYCA